MKVLDKVMETLTAMKAQIETMQGSVNELAAKIEAIQNSEGTVFDPNGSAAESELFPKEFAKKEAAE
jgi:prefoldin subunit 5